MSPRRVLLAAGAVVLVIGLLTCRESPVGPTPGWLNLRLVTPNADDGGILFSVTGPGVDTIVSLFPNTFVSRESSSSMRVVMVGSIAPGLVARVHVPELAAASAYRATMLQVAAQSTFAQRPLDGYVLTVEPSP